MGGSIMIIDVIESAMAWKSSLVSWSTVSPCVDVKPATSRWTATQSS